MNDKIFKTLFMFSFVKLLILLICTSCTGNVTDTVKETAGDSTGTLIPHVESLTTDTSDITRRLPSQYEIDSIKKIRANFLDSVRHVRRQDSIDESRAIQKIENKIRMNFPAVRFLYVELGEGNYIIIDLGTGVLYKKEFYTVINPGYVTYAYQSVTPLYDSLGKPLRIEVPPILRFESIHEEE